MHDITYLDMLQLVRELKRFEGARIEKFYSLGDGVFRFKLSKRGEQQYALVVRLCSYVCITNLEEKSDSIDQFTAAVRKHVSGAMISSISLYNDDRILGITSKKGDTEFNILIEMFGKGNLIVTDRVMKILSCYVSHAYRDRSVRPRDTYLPPSTRSISTGDADFAEKLLSGMNNYKGKTALQSASRLLNMGSIYVSEAFKRAGLNAEAERLSEAEVASLADRIKEVASETQEGKVYIIKNDGKPEDYMLCRPSSKEFEVEERSGLLEALSEFYAIDAMSVREEKNEKVEELEKSIEKQLAYLDSVDREILENKKKGEQVYNNMVRFNQLIAYLSKERRATLEEVQERFPDLRILSIDKKTRRIKVEVDA